MREPDVCSVLVRVHGATVRMYERTRTAIDLLCIRIALPDYGGLISARCKPQFSGDDRRRCGPLEVDYTEADTRRRSCPRKTMCLRCRSQLTARLRLVKHQLTAAINVNWVKRKRRASSPNLHRSLSSTVIRRYTRGY